MIESEGLPSFARSLFRLYPRQTASILSAFLVAGIMEGVGVTSLLPLLTLLTGPQEAAPALLHHHIPLPAGMAGIGPLLAFIVFLLAAKAVISLAAMRKVGSITAAIGEDLRMRLIRGLLRARWSHFGRLAAGRSANALGTEARRASEAYMYLGKAMADTIQIAVYIGFAFFISPAIALGALALSALLIPGFARLIRKARQAGHAQTGLLSVILARITDALAGIKTIKAMGREPFFENLFAAEVKNLARAERHEFMAMQLLALAREPVIAFVLACGLYGAVRFGGIPLPELLVLAFMFFRVASKLTVVQTGYQRAAALESAYRSIQAAIAEAERAQEPQREPGAAQTPPPQGRISFEKVCFAHTADGAPQIVLRDVNAVFPACAFSAVIGPSGAGKTTLVDLLVGLHAPSVGRILIDGVPLSAIDMMQWRHAIGYLPQECPIFHDTIFNNIAMGDPAVTPDNAIDALRRAGAWEFMETLEHGIETIAGERGSRFSGGQRQRIAIARALAAKPRLLLLDEPTSALDAETERRFLETIRELARHTTIIAISHNPAVAAHADHVFRLQNGGLEAV